MASQVLPFWWSAPLPQAGIYKGLPTNTGICFRNSIADSNSNQVFQNVVHNQISDKQHSTRYMNGYLAHENKQRWRKQLPTYSPFWGTEMTHEQHQHHHPCRWCNNYCTSIVDQIARTNLYHHPLANGCVQPHLKSIGHGIAAGWNGKLATSLGSFRVLMHVTIVGKLSSAPFTTATPLMMLVWDPANQNSSDE